MTSEEKINWLENANTDELLNQFMWTVRKLDSAQFEDQFEAMKDYELVTAELKKRLDK